MSDSQTKHEHHDHDMTGHGQHTSARADAHMVHGREAVEAPSAHEMHAKHAAHGMSQSQAVAHAGHVDHSGHEDMFRRRFWVSLLLAAGILADAGILHSPAVGALFMSVSVIVVAINVQLLRRVDLSL